VSVFIRYIYHTEDNPDRIMSNTFERKFHSVRPQDDIEMTKLYRYIKGCHPGAKGVLIIEAYDEELNKGYGTLGGKIAGGVISKFKDGAKRSRVGNFE